MRKNSWLDIIKKIKKKIYDCQSTRIQTYKDKV